MRIVESVLASNSTLSPRVTHKLKGIKGLSKKDMRKRCIGCYEDLAKKNGRTFAILRATKVSTRCSRCEKYYCPVCFQKIIVNASKAIPLCEIYSLRYYCCKIFSK